MTILEFLQTTKGATAIVLLLLSFVKIPKLELNLWKWIGKGVGKVLNAEVITKIDQVEKTLKDHVAKDELSYAKTCRRDILKFNDEILLNIKHTQEHFTEILEVIDDYEKYCEAHPDYPNNKAILAIENIKTTYSKCLKEHAFL